MKPKRKRSVPKWAMVVTAAVLLLVVAFGAYKLKFEQPTQIQIEQAVETKNWKRAVSLLNRVDLTLDDGRNYFNLGLARMNSGDTEGAIEAFMGADDRNYKRADARFYIASLYAKNNEPHLAMQWLNDSLESGLTGLAAIESDPYLSKLSQTPEWKALYLGDDMEDEDEKRALDFLVGTWSVTGGRGFGGRTVTITKLFDGAISESWPAESPGGSMGMFVFDPEKQKWSYSFVDGIGRVFNGVVLTGRQITITGTLKYADGTEYLRRIEILSSGSGIDYVSRLSRDDGKNWDDPARLRLTPLSDLAGSTF